jgi:alanyl-tRNA synthetase
LIASSEIRQQFLDFFKSKGHTIVPSAPVIPYDDPTLLFTNAGMNQFKDVFLGTGTRPYTRCADTQKCIRVSGKHNDLEEVGHDGYHHTFFEMLGNWSFGDYYKEEAIKWAWELLTDIWKIPKNRLWATIFNTDDESYELWKKVTDIKPENILRFDEKENFWEMSETGPCGPCSEIHIDLTKTGCKSSDINSGNPEVIELWNLVFIQYNRDSKGELHPLPKRHVDTGMGFERLVRVLQNKTSNYETDIFLPLINELIYLTGKDYTGDKIQSAMNVVADHIRALTFAIAEGAMPSNEGRGYVLRRILRRAARYGRNLNMHNPFIYNLVDVLVKTMGHQFPEIVEKSDFIKDVIRGEEESFNETLDRGLVLFNEEIEKMKKSGAKIFSGDVAFKLHDTYGFPIDLTQLMAKEKEYEIDINRFNELMEQAKSLSRAYGQTWVISENEYDELAGEKGRAQLFYNPYIDKREIETKVLRVENRYNDRSGILLSLNPFYKESGGQVSDTGEIIINGRSYEIRAVYGENIIEVDELDAIETPINVVARLDYPRRLSIQRNHSATHLVHEVLRRVLGDHVRQMGSYLDDKLLRFDFPHFHKLTTGEIGNIEEIVNEKVRERINVYSEKLPLDKANKIPNVKKLFGEKYGDEVRVVFIDEKFSVEFCGGTHVKETPDIGLFKIVKEESVSSGIRRIFARTGEGVLHYINERVSDIEKILTELPEKYSPNIRKGIEAFSKDFKSADFRDVELLKKLLSQQDSTVNSLLEQREKYLEEKKKAEKQLAKDKVKKASETLDELLSKSIHVDGMKVVASEFDVDNMDELKEIGDSLRQKIGSGVGLLYSVIDNKINLVTVITDNLIKEKGLNAGKIAGDVAKILGGGGGGKPHLATAGGKDVSKLNEAVAKFPDIVKKYLR